MTSVIWRALSYLGWGGDSEPGLLAGHALQRRVENLTLRCGPAVTDENCARQACCVRLAVRTRGTQPGPGRSVTSGTDRKPSTAVRDPAPSLPPARPGCPLLISGFVPGVPLLGTPCPPPQLERVLVRAQSLACKAPVQCRCLHTAAPIPQARASRGPARYEEIQGLSGN